MPTPDAKLVINGTQIGLIANGDGTYALQTSASITGGGDATAANQTSMLTKLDTLITLLGTSLATQVWKKVGAFTTSQTGVAIWTPAAGKKIAITHIFLTSSGTDPGLARLWFGASGDTTYNDGTDQLVIVMNFGPVSTADAESFPGMPLALASPIVAVTADHILRLDTTGNLDIEGVIYGYEF